MVAEMKFRSANRHTTTEKIARTFQKSSAIMCRYRGATKCRGRFASLTRCRTATKYRSKCATRWPITIAGLWHTMHHVQWVKNPNFSSLNEMPCFSAFLLLKAKMWVTLPCLYSKCSSKKCLWFQIRKELKLISQSTYSRFNKLYS